MRTGLGPLAAMMVLCVPASAQLRTNGRVLEVASARVRLVFTGPDVTRIENLVTGETHADEQSAGAAIGGVTRASGANQSAAGFEWRLGEVEGVSVATLTGPPGAPAFRMDVWVDPVADQPVARVSAPGARGVRGARWGLRGLDIAAHRLILPVAGGTYFDARRPPPRGFTASSESRWEAPFLMLTSGLGGLVVYNARHEAPYRSLGIVESSEGRFSLAVEAVARGPWASSGPDAAEWRIDCFQGTWMTGADLYRGATAGDWDAPSIPASAGWVRDIRTVVIFSGGLLNLDELAALTSPRQTLLYLPNWRAAGYDRNYPDYTPLPELPAFMDRARRLGFRVMLHVNPYGVSTYHPEYAGMRRYQVRDSATLEPQGWLWDRPVSEKARFAYINPAAREWRALFLRSVRPAIAQLRPDALHLDQTGVSLNDGNGPVDSLTAVEGTLQLHRDLSEQFPNLSLGSEGVYDGLAPRVWFAQRWSAAEQGVPGAPHPLMTYLLGSRFKVYGYIGMPGPESPEYLGYFRQYERQAVIPTIALSDPGELANPGPGIVRAFRIARAFQDHALDVGWDAASGDDRIVYRGAAEGVFRAGVPVTRLEAGGKPVYERASGAASIKSYLRVSNWPAWDDEGHFGLDPLAEYWLDPATPPDGPRFARLPDGVSLTNDAVHASGASLLALRPARAKIFDAIESFGAARAGVAAASDGPLSGDAGVSVETLRVGNAPRAALLVHPPGGAAATYLEFRLDIPAEGSIALSYAVGVADDAQRTAPVTFEVRADGALLWSQDAARGEWRAAEAGLTPFAGRTIALRFLTRAANSSYAWAGFANPVVTRAPAASAVSAQLIAPGVASAAVRAPVTVSGGSGVFEIANAPASGLTPVFYLPLRAFAAGQSLLETPPDNFQTIGAAMPVAGPVFGSGKVEPATSGGSTRARAISAHPPEQGTTRLIWYGELPAAPLALEATAGLQDGNRSSGVIFKVSVNGETMWEYKPGARGWASSRIDLSRFRGGPAMIQLITDSAGSNSYDWAYWTGLTFSTR